MLKNFITCVIHGQTFLLPSFCQILQIVFISFVEGLKITSWLFSFWTYTYFASCFIFSDALYQILMCTIEKIIVIMSRTLFHIKLSWCLSKNQRCLINLNEIWRYKYNFHNLNCNWTPLYVKGMALLYQNSDLCEIWLLKPSKP